MDLALSFQRQLEEKDEHLRVLESQVAALKVQQNGMDEAEERTRVLQSQVEALHMQLAAADEKDEHIKVLQSQVCSMCVCGGDCTKRRETQSNYDNYNPV